ncbi:hypothetical protein EV424DRAFT_1349304 [Suillus variegatus]|nr:hypothetical protein EV424DRAFT_1349304 [Suillus variegatus]
MPHPPIHKTEEEKLAASRERRRHHYEKRQLTNLSKETETPSQEVQEIQKALAEALGDDEDKIGASEPETSDSDDDALSDLPSCLLTLESIKDEMLALINEPCAFVESLLLQQHPVFFGY